MRWNNDPAGRRCVSKGAFGKEKVSFYISPTSINELRVSRDLKYVDKSKRKKIQEFLENNGLDEDDYKIIDFQTSRGFDYKRIEFKIALATLGKQNKCCLFICPQDYSDGGLGKRQRDIADISSFETKLSYSTN